MKKFLKKHGLNFAYSLFAIMIMWLVWAIACFAVKNEYVIPSIESTVAEFISLIADSFFWQSFLSSLLRTIFAFLISFILGGLFAVISTVFKPIGRLIKPIIAIFRTLPTMAVILLILIWSSPTFAPVIVAILVLFPLIYSQFITGIESIDEGVYKALKIFNVSKKDRIFKILIPQVAPSVFLNVGANLSFSIKLIVSAEVMAYTFKGLGGMMKLANAYVNPARLMALTLVAVFSGIIIELLFHLIFKNCFRWNKTEVINDKN